MYKRILVPYDGCAASKRGLQEAVALSKALQAQLRIIHIVEDPLLVDYSGMVNVGEILDSLRRSGQQMLDATMKELAGQGVKADSQLLEAVGTRVADVVVKQAADWPAELIVMGTHGRRGVSHLLLGSDAEAVLKLSPVPVLLVRG